ncbi:MAG: hypothetical protein AMK69_22065 [Nitrospira bacterium SG8_3]|nr:MAG: hypothetical protein AMK69_22065 [Nitrospira bacterium SG8_3]
MNHPGEKDGTSRENVAGRRGLADHEMQKLEARSTKFETNPKFECFNDRNSAHTLATPQQQP